MKTLFIKLRSPWENRYIESFNGKLRDELLNRETFTTLEEVRVLIEQWRKEYNQVHPHNAKINRPPAPEAIFNYGNDVRTGTTKVSIPSGTNDEG